MVGKDFQTTAGRMAGTGKRTKAQTGAERVKKAHDKKKGSGLFLLRSWVPDTEEAKAKGRACAKRLRKAAGFVE